MSKGKDYVKVFIVISSIELPSQWAPFKSCFSTRIWTVEAIFHTSRI